MQVSWAAPNEVISTFSSGRWDLNLHPASWPFFQAWRDLGRGCHWPSLQKLLPLPGQPECLSRDPASCFQLASCEQCGLCHSSLMKLSTETTATWKTHGPQALVVLCHGIYQLKSNSRTLNIWIRISLAKCFTQRLLVKKGWVGLQTAGQTVMQIPNEAKLVISLDLLPHSLKQGLSYTEKQIFLLAGFISPQIRMLPDAASTCNAKLPPTLFNMHKSLKQAYEFSLASSDVLVGVLQTQHKSFICTMLYMIVIESGKLNRIQFSSAYAGHGPHYSKASTFSENWL